MCEQLILPSFYLYAKIESAMRRLNIKYLVISLILILSLILGVGCALLPDIDIDFPQLSNPTPTPTPTPTTPPVPINPTYEPPPLETDAPPLPSIADVVAKVKPSVVAINTEVVTFDRPFTQEGAGSGWIIDENGIIVTNNHVIEGAKAITVTLDNGNTFTVGTNSVFTDRLNDLAILKIDAQNLPALKVGDSSELRVGDWVVAIGNSLGQGIRATQGIVSRQGVSVSVQGQTLYNLIETSAAINRGNSGGPLVNMAGEVIGITSVKVIDIDVEGVGWAISTETAIPIIEALVENGYVIRPWLGVALYAVDQYAVNQYDLAVEEGVLVTEVISGSPAAKAGIEPGDVIVSFNGQETTTAQDIVRAIHSSQIGQAVEIVFWRGNTENTTFATLIERPRP